MFDAMFEDRKYSNVRRVRKQKEQKFRLISNEEKFWSSTTKGEGDDCWEWKGKRRPRGQPAISTSTMYGGVQFESAQTYSYILYHKQEPPPGYVVHNSCGNENCVNPKHLWLVDKPTYARARKEYNAKKRMLARAKLEGESNDKEIQDIVDQYNQILKDRSKE
jgi:hypothetical protein